MEKVKLMSIEDLRNSVRSGELSPKQVLAVVEQELLARPTAAWWVLRGDMIQLSDGAGHQLEDAAESYERAVALDPNDPEPLEELGHLYDAVVGDPARAREYYLAAIVKGAGETCARALAELDSANG